MRTSVSMFLGLIIWCPSAIQQTTEEIGNAIANLMHRHILGRGGGGVYGNFTLRNFRWKMKFGKEYRYKVNREKICVFFF